MSDEPQVIRVLLVENDPEDAVIFRRRATECTRHRIVTDAVSNCAETMRRLAEQHYDLAFLDYDLDGGENGVEVLKSIRAAGYELPAIAITGSGSERVAVAMMKAGATDYLVKEAFDGDVLERSVHYVLEVQRLERERRLANEALADAAARWQQTFDAIEDMVAVMDRDRTIVRANRAMMEAFPRCDIVGAKCHRLVHGTDHPPTGCPSRGAFAGRGASHTEIVERHMDNRRLEVAVYPIEGRDGEVEGVVHIMRDVTELRRAQEAFVEVEKLRATRDLAGGVAHNFNNLTTAILGYLGFVREDLEKHGLPADDVAAATECIQRAAGLARELHQWTQPTGGPRERMTLAGLARTLRERVGRMLPPGIDFQADVTEYGVEARIDVATEALLDALLSICDNAIEAMPDGGKLTLTLSTLERTPPGEGFSGRREMFAAIAIADTGTGMTPDVQAKVFEPFFSTKNTVGVGLSLALARRVVAANGGTIEADSEPGKGTTFRVLLPMSPPGAEPDTRRGPEGESTASATTRRTEQ